MKSLHLYFFLLLFSPPLCTSSRCFFPPCCLCRTFLFYWSLAGVGGERGGLIKEPDWSVNSAQRCMESTRPSDGPNRASYCKQHAHLDRSRPQGGTGESSAVDKLALIKKGSLSWEMLEGWVYRKLETSKLFNVKLRQSKTQNTFFFCPFLSFCLCNTNRSEDCVLVSSSRQQQRAESMK